jgi:hypothetical protein
MEVGRNLLILFTLSNIYVQFIPRKFSQSLPASHSKGSTQNQAELVEITYI